MTPNGTWKKQKKHKVTVTNMKDQHFLIDKANSNLKLNKIVAVNSIFKYRNILNTKHSKFT